MPDTQRFSYKAPSSEPLTEDDLKVGDLFANMFEKTGRLVELRISSASFYVPFAATVFVILNDFDVREPPAVFAFVDVLSWPGP